VAPTDADRRRLTVGEPDTVWAATSVTTGRALWRVGSRSFVVAHQRSAIEASLTDTDSAMDAVGT
jgi:hypothetical protein